MSVAVAVAEVKPKPVKAKPEPKPAPKAKPDTIQVAIWLKPLPAGLAPLPTPEGRGPKVVPAACAYDQPGMELDSIGCQSRPGVKYTFVEGQGWQLADPKPEPEVARPSKPEYIRAFQREGVSGRGRLPTFVLARWFTTNDVVAEYKDQSAALPRSARRALDQYHFSDLSSAYDVGLIARIVYYCQHHKTRAYRSKYLSV